MSLRQAKPKEEQIVALLRFLEHLEELLKSGAGPKKVFEFLIIEFHNVKLHYRRIISALSVLLDACCDPDLVYLDWKPEIKKIFETKELYEQEKDKNDKLFQCLEQRIEKEKERWEKLKNHLIQHREKLGIKIKKMIVEKCAFGARAPLLLEDMIANDFLEKMKELEEG